MKKKGQGGEEEQEFRTALPANRTKKKRWKEHLSEDGGRMKGIKKKL